MRRLIRPVLAATERAGQRRERIASLVEESSIRIGASRQQQACDLERRVSRIARLETRIARIEQRLPVQGSAFHVQQRRPPIKYRADLRDIAGGGGRVDAGARNLRMVGQQPASSGRRWVHAGVRQTGEADEHVDA